jgi:tRNA (guanine-N7-)-methyltransferase
MTRRNKLMKFAELGQFENVFENMDSSRPGIYDANGNLMELKNRWNEVYFNNSHPIVLELACGRGEYTIGLAKLDAKKNYLGIDVKGARIWKGARAAIDQKLRHACFLRTRIEQLQLFIGNQEISEIWIIFPDPFLNQGKVNRRLTSPFFLNIYAHILQPNSLVHLKTDNLDLFEFTIEQVKKSPMFQLEEIIGDIYDGRELRPELQIRTYYEDSHLKEGRTIRYVKFKYIG